MSIKHFKNAVQLCISSLGKLTVGYVTSMEPVLHNCTARVQCAGRNAHTLCHELHLCHCNLECDASLPVNEDHMTAAGCQLKNKTTTLLGYVCFCIQTK